MGITRVATLRRKVARLRELDTTQIIHAGTPHGVAHNVMLFVLAVSLRGLLTT